MPRHTNTATKHAIYHTSPASVYQPSLRHTVLKDALDKQIITRSLADEYSLSPELYKYHGHPLELDD